MSYSEKLVYDEDAFGHPSSPDEEMAFISYHEGSEISWVSVLASKYCEIKGINFDDLEPGAEREIEVTVS